MPALPSFSNVHPCRKPLLFLVSLLFCLLGAGCAAVGIRDSSLEIQITPLPVLRGQPALAKVNAPLDAARVIGKVLVAGSPELLFQRDKDKGLWYFYGTIPFSPWVQPGHYTVRVMVFSEGAEKPHYSETQVDLK